MNELERLQVAWTVYQEAVESARRSIASSEWTENPEFVNLFDSYRDEIAENKETLAGFYELMRKEMSDIEDDHVDSSNDD